MLEKHGNYLLSWPLRVGSTTFNCTIAKIMRSPISIYVVSADWTVKCEYYSRGGSTGLLSARKKKKPGLSVMEWIDISHLREKYGFDHGCIDDLHSPFSPIPHIRDCFGCWRTDNWYSLNPK